MEQQIASNQRKTAVLLIALILLFALVFGLTFLFSAEMYLSIGVTSALIIYVLVTYFTSMNRLLKLNGAQLVTRRSHRRLYEMADNISISLGIKTPNLYVINDPALNAFAAGKNPESSIVGVTQGLLEALDEKELEGVLAHEFGHIINRDVRLNTIAFAVTVGFLFLLDVARLMLFTGGGRDRKGDVRVLFIILVVAGIVGFIFSTLIRLAISRRREYLADVTSAQITRYPDGLRSALEKIAKHGSVLQKSSNASAHLFISNPLKGIWSKIFSTHPPIEDRIEKLKHLNQMGY